MVTADVGDYRAMRRVRDRLGSNTLLVCGEVDTDPPNPVFRDLVNTGLIDDYQPDIVVTGFSRWQRLEEWLKPTGVISQPRNFGNANFGTRAALVFGAASPTFCCWRTSATFPTCTLPTTCRSLMALTRFRSAWAWGCNRHRPVPPEVRGPRSACHVDSCFSVTSAEPSIEPRGPDHRWGR